MDVFPLCGQAKLRQLRVAGMTLASAFPALNLLLTAVGVLPWLLSRPWKQNPDAAPGLGDGLSDLLAAGRDVNALAVAFAIAASVISMWVCVCMYVYNGMRGGREGRAGARPLPSLRL